MDIVAKDRRNTIEGQYDLFGGDGLSYSTPDVAMPDIPEFSRQELMRMEKETTGLYLTGHPMDDYRDTVRQLRAAPIGAILSDFDREEGPQTYQDGQRVTLAGVVTSAKTKTTKNHTLMAYVGLEDDTGAMEMLVFAKTLAQCAPFLKEGMAILVEGRLSVRDEKAPQLMCDRARPLTETENTEAPNADGPVSTPPAGGKLYLKLPSAEDPRMRKLSLILDMFPGRQPVVLYCVDTQKRLGAVAQLHPSLIKALKELLGEENVVLK
jgi:DNA polymerase-3 subunit alpha